MERVAMDMLPARVAETNDPPFRMGDGSTGPAATCDLSDDPVAGVSPEQTYAFRAAMSDALRARVVQGWKDRGVTVESWGRTFAVTGREPGDRAWQQVAEARVDIWCDALRSVDPLQVIRAAGLAHHPVVRRP